MGGAVLPSIWMESFKPVLLGDLYAARHVAALHLLCAGDFGACRASLPEELGAADPHLPCVQCDCRESLPSFEAVRSSQLASLARLLHLYCRFRKHPYCPSGVP